MVTPGLEGVREGMLAAEAEQRFWEEHYAEFLAKYPEQFVAIKDGMVVAAEDDLSQLILLLSTKQIDISDTRVRFITAQPNNMLL